MKKPYLKLSATLASFGTGLFLLERYGLNELKGINGGNGLGLDPNIVGLLVIVPFLLIGAAAVVFMVGKMRRL
jgi:hypothetical protein